MNDLNLLVFTGRLTKDPEFVDKGTFQVAKFSVAINYNYKKEEVWETETTYVDVTVWNNLATICEKILHKGCLVSAEGRIVQDHWETTDGEKRSKLVMRGIRINKLKDAPGHIKETELPPGF